MYIQFFAYQIIKNKWRFFLFRLFLVFLIIYFNAQYSLCAPKLEDLASLSDENFVNFFFDWISNCKLPDDLFEGQYVLKNNLEQQTLNQLTNDLKKDFQSLALQRNRQLDIDEIYTLRRYAQNLSRPSNMDSSTLVVRKDSQVELSVLKIVNKYLPNLKEGLLLKSYLDRSDYRHEVKQELNNLLKTKKTHKWFDRNC